MVMPVTWEHHRPRQQRRCDVRAELTPGSKTTRRKILAAVLAAGFYVRLAQGWSNHLRLTSDQARLRPQASSGSRDFSCAGHARCGPYARRVILSPGLPLGMRAGLQPTWKGVMRVSTDDRELETDPLWLGLDLSTQSLTGAVLRGDGMGTAFNEPVVLESINFDVRTDFHENDGPPQDRELIEESWLNEVSVSW